MPSKLFDEWLEPTATSTTDAALYSERSGCRPKGMAQLQTLVADHFVGVETVLKLGGYTKAAVIIRNSLPTNKKTRSGDFGELIATEYIDTQTEYRVPVRKLRWKSDREMPMHGNDVIAIAGKSNATRVLKGECKSGQYVGEEVLSDACEGLDGHKGRPNPSTLAFITKRLYEANRDAEARVFEQLQAGGLLSASRVRHLVFVVCQNNPSKHFGSMPKPTPLAIKRRAVAVILAEHAKFVAAVFDSHGK